MVLPGVLPLILNLTPYLPNTASDLLPPTSHPLPTSYHPLPTSHLLGTFHFLPPTTHFLPPTAHLPPLKCLPLPASYLTLPPSYIPLLTPDFSPPTAANTRTHPQSNFHVELPFPSEPLEPISRSLPSPSLRVPEPATTMTAVPNPDGAMPMTEAASVGLVADEPSREVLAPQPVLETDPQQVPKQNSWQEPKQYSQQCPQREATMDRELPPAGDQGSASGRNEALGQDSAPARLFTFPSPDREKNTNH